MSGFKPIDASKEEYRKYLERNGVMDALTKALLKCNSERPADPVAFLMENLGESDVVVSLREELQNAHAEIERLRNELQVLTRLTEGNEQNKPTVDAKPTSETGTGSSNGAEKKEEGKPPSKLIAEVAAATEPSIKTEKSEESEESKPVVVDVPTKEEQKDQSVEKPEEVEKEAKEKK